MTRLTLPLICECLLLCIPLNIYVIGNNLAEGVQWALFRYQQSSQGNSLILIHKDLHYVTGGILRGASATSTIIWIVGAVLLVAAVLALALAAVRHTPDLVRPAGMLTVLTGALFLLAELVEYGPVLSNLHGSSIPIGVPVIIVAGLWLIYGEFGTGDEDTQEPGELPGESTGREPGDTSH
jgi:uncharacterized membrane protein YecN with MAPEG domain